LLDLLNWFLNILSDVVKRTLDSIFNRKLAFLVQVWESSLPIWSNVDVELSILVLKEKFLVTKVTLDDWGVQVEFTNENFFRFWFSSSEHFVENSSLWNGDKLISEILLKVVWEHGFHLISCCVEELEWELEVLNIFTSLIVFWHFRESNMLKRILFEFKITLMILVACLNLVPMIPPGTLIWLVKSFLKKFHESC